MAVSFLVGADVLRRAALMVVVAAGAVLSAATMVDRVAVIVNKQVITEREVIREVKARALYEEQGPVLTGASKRAAADRLIDRILIQGELYLLAQDEESRKASGAFVASVNQTRFGGSDERQKALRGAELTPEEWTAYLTEMEATVRLVDVRFRPAVQLTDAEVTDYYEFEFAPAWRRRTTEAVPTLTANREEIEAAMVETRVTQALDRWLNQARIQTRIKYIDEVFQ